MRVMDFVAICYVGFLMVLIILTCFIVLNNPNQLQLLGFEGNKTTFRVDCNSNSMGFTLDCNDLVTAVRIPITDKLIPNRIYVYRTINILENGDFEDINIVHRFLGCIDDNCSILKFKGDNNDFSEDVQRSQVKYIVTDIHFV